MPASDQEITTKLYGSPTDNPTVDKPGGEDAQPGDLVTVFMFIFDGGSAPAITLPDGFETVDGFPITITAPGNECRQYAFSKFLQPDEPDSWTWALDAARSTQLIAVRITGADIDHMLDVAATTNQGTGSTRVWSGLTTETDNVLLLGVGWDVGNFTNDLTPPAGMEELFDGVIAYLFTGNVPTAGTVVADKSHTNNGTPWSSSLLAFRSAAPPAFDVDLLTTGTGPAEDSLGGDISATTIEWRPARSTGEVYPWLEESGLWPETVPREIADPGGTIYRCTGLRNNESLKTLSVTWYVERQYETSLALEIGLAPEDPGDPVEVLTNQFTAPDGVVFSAPESELLAIGPVLIPPGEWQGVWQALTVPEGALSDLDGQAWTVRFVAVDPDA